MKILWDIVWRYAVMIICIFLVMISLSVCSGCSDVSLYTGVDVTPGRDGTRDYWTISQGVFYRLGPGEGETKKGPR